MRTFPLYNDLTSRDLLQRRATDAAGSTAWVDSPLTAAARNGDVCVLDGIERLDVQTLLSLKRLLHDAVLDLPDGSLLVGGNASDSTLMNVSDSKKLLHDGNMTRSVQRIHPSFRVIVLGMLPSSKAVTESARQRWISSASDLGLAHHFMQSPTSADMRAVLKRGSEALAEIGAIKLDSKRWQEIESHMSEAINKILSVSGVSTYCITLRPFSDFISLHGDCLPRKQPAGVDSLLCSRSSHSKSPGGVSVSRHGSEQTKAALHPRGRVPGQISSCSRGCSIRCKESTTIWILASISLN